jgi:hexosaminidase
MTGNRIAALFIVASCIWSWQSAQADTSIALVPKPLRMERTEGKFVLDRDTVVLVDRDSADAASVGKQLAERIRRTTGFNPAVTPHDGKAATRNAVLLTTKPASKGTVPFSLPRKSGQSPLGPEGYALRVTPDGVMIAAGDGPGLFYGMQTLLQLLPPQVLGPNLVGGDVTWAVPAVKIEDRPQFRWRGLLLDVARHFFSKQEVENFIDLMAQHKLNTLQIHLTDNEGWRIEIKRYPKLTAKSAWRTSDPWFGTKYPADKPYGGFFTQDDVREIVAYAKARYINVVPEIEMPAHTGGAIAAYPQISCTGKMAYEVCPGNDATFELFEGVLAEVCEVFPSKYIHIGGDEASKESWKTCPKCQARMKREGLKNVDELQSYFIRRIEKFLNARGRTLVGWDEILEGGVAPNAVVMSWRGMEGGIAAAKAGHDVVMTPIVHCYFDFPQARTGEPRGGDAIVSLRSVYNFEPVPRGLSADKAKHVLGGGGNLWTERVPDYRYAQYMVYPRACAMAEATWTDPRLKDWKDFRNRLDVHLERLKAQGVNYRQPRADDDAK